MATKYARGWPERPEKPLRKSDRCITVPISRVLKERFPTDVHFAPYSSERNSRLRSEAAGQVAVTMTALVLDVDGPDHERTSAFTRDLVPKLADMNREHPGACGYWTRGGARIIYAIEPFEIEDTKDAARWKRSYLVALRYFEDKFGIVADPACADWTRLYRAPHATRDKGGKPEELGVFGAVDDLGMIQITASEDTLKRAQSAAKKVWYPRRDLGPVGESDGEFFRLLNERGDVLGRRGDAWVIRCPNHAAHTMGADGDGRTYLYPPRGNKTLGAIWCFHAHCQSLRAPDWLDLLGARRAAR